MKAAALAALLLVVAATGCGRKPLLQDAEDRDPPARIATPYLPEKYR